MVLKEELFDIFKKDPERFEEVYTKVDNAVEKTRGGIEYWWNGILKRNNSGTEFWPDGSIKRVLNGNEYWPNGKLKKDKLGREYPFEKI